MTELSIRVPSKLDAQIRERMVESGMKSVDQYVKNLIVADVAQNQEIDPELEAMLLSRLNDKEGWLEYTPAYKKKFKAQLLRRIKKTSRERRK